MGQGSLDFSGEAYARTADPTTSHEAADAMAGDNARRMEEIVLAALGDLGGSGTTYEITRRVQLTRPEIADGTVTPRMKPLEKKGLVFRTDRRGPGHGNRTQIVWEMVDSDGAAC